MEPTILFFFFWIVAVRVLKFEFVNFGEVSWNVSPPSSTCESSLSLLFGFTESSIFPSFFSFVVVVDDDDDGFALSVVSVDMIAFVVVNDGDFMVAVVVYVAFFL